LVVGMAAAAMTMRSPLYNGPIATALDGADLSWIVGFPVSALVYAGLMRFRAPDARALGLAAPKPLARR
jgi:NCS1 family nucleobase:cation symporter-1